MSKSEGVRRIRPKSALSSPALSRFDGVPDRSESHAERQRTHHSCQTFDFSRYRSRPTRFYFLL